MNTLPLALGVRKFQPLDVAEVLTVGQLRILGVHADGTLVDASLLGSQGSLEGVVVTLVIDHLQRLDREDMLLAVLVGVDVYFLQADGIVKTLLVDDVLDGVLLACLGTACGQIPLAADDIDSIPALGDNFLPLSNLLCQLVVVGREFLETLCFLLVEL